jgi:hypothetical protein
MCPARPTVSFRETIAELDEFTDTLPPSIYDDTDDDSQDNHTANALEEEWEFGNSVGTLRSLLASGRHSDNFRLRLPFLLSVSDGHPKHGYCDRKVFSSFLAMGSATPSWNATAQAAERRYRVYSLWWNVGAQSTEELMALAARYTGTKDEDGARVFQSSIESAYKLALDQSAQNRQQLESAARKIAHQLQAEAIVREPVVGIADSMVDGRYDVAARMIVAPILGQAYGLPTAMPLLGQLPLDATERQWKTYLRRSAQATIQEYESIRRLNARIERQLKNAQRGPKNTTALMAAVSQLPYLTRDRIEAITKAKKTTAWRILKWWSEIGETHNTGSGESIVFLP